MKSLGWLISVLLLLVSVVAFATVTVTVDGEVVDVESVVVNIQTLDDPDPPVEPPDPPVEPPVEPPEPPNECQDNSVDPITLRSWNQVFLGQFPMPTYQNVSWLVVPRFGYLSIAFNTGNTDDDGKISLLENSATGGIRKTSISECKGDLEVDSSCFKSYGLGGGLQWATNGRQGACQLKQNTTYYFNTTFLDANTNNGTWCVGTPCYVNIQVTNF